LAHITIFHHGGKLPKIYSSTGLVKAAKNLDANKGNKNGSIYPVKVEALIRASWFFASAFAIIFRKLFFQFFQLFFILILHDILKKVDQKLFSSTVTFASPHRLSKS